MSTQPDTLIKKFLIPDTFGMFYLPSERVLLRVQWNILKLRNLLFPVCKDLYTSKCSSFGTSRVYYNRGTPNINDNQSY